MSGFFYWKIWTTEKQISYAYLLKITFSHFQFSTWKPCLYNHQLLWKLRNIFLAVLRCSKYPSSPPKYLHPFLLLLLNTLCAFGQTINRLWLIAHPEWYILCSLSATAILLVHPYHLREDTLEQKWCMSKSYLKRQNRSLLISKCHVVRLWFSEKNF